MGHLRKLALGTIFVAGLSMFLVSTGGLVFGSVLFSLDMLVILSLFYAGWLVVTRGVKEPVVQNGFLGPELTGDEDSTDDEKEGARDALSS